MAQTQWLFYDWHTEDAPARFGVDMALSSAAPNPNRPVMICIECAARDAGAGELSSREQSHIRRMGAKILRLIDCVQAGLIELPDRTQLFYYAKSRGAHRTLDELALKERLLVCRTGCVEEPDWDTYFNLLYPDAAKFQTVENKKIIELLERNGDGITAARRLRLHMFFPTEPLRVMFAEQARLSGFATGETEFTPEYDQPYGLQLMRISTLDKAEVDEITTRAIRVAERFEGTLRFWDCQLVPKKNPLRGF